MPAEFGATAWGRSWLRTIERTVGVPDPQLPRARSIARNQQAALTVEPGLIMASITDRSATATVRVELPLWSDQHARTLADYLHRARANHPASLAGDVPDAVLEELAEAGISVAVPLGESTIVCDCRARRRPCVHALATIYALALRVDEEPVLALDLRGAVAHVEADDPSDWIPLDRIDPAAFYVAPRPTRRASPSPSAGNGSYRRAGA